MAAREAYRQAIMHTLCGGHVNHHQYSDNVGHSNSLVTVLPTSDIVYLLVV